MNSELRTSTFEALSREALLVFAVNLADQRDDLLAAAEARLEAYHEEEIRAATARLEGAVARAKGEGL